MKLSFEFFRRFAVVAIAAMVLGLGAAPAFSQEFSPEHLAIARKYIDLTDQGNIYEVALLEAGVRTKRTLMGMNADISDEANEAIGRTIAAYTDKKGELMDQFARHYALRFSMEELQEIVKFYESEVGQKLAKQNSEINQDLQLVMTIFEENLSSEFFAAVRANLRAAGVDI